MSEGSTSLAIRCYDPLLKSLLGFPDFSQSNCTTSAEIAKLAPAHGSAVL